MASPPSDGPLLSSSPISIRGPSPVRRRGDRDASSQTESIIIDPIIRQRRSPTLTRSFDVHDPDARERQRTMDVDMALHLSLARRENVVSPPSPYDGPRLPDAETPFGALSVAERHDIELARGEGHHSLHHAFIDCASEETIHAPRPATPLDLRLQELSQTQDSSLMAGIESHYPLTHNEDASTSMAGLPTYQAHVSRSVFDFSALESFAAEEKANLGLTWPINAQPFKLRYSSAQRVSEAGQLPSPPSTSTTASDQAGDSSATPPRPGARQRKLSQSAPVPRPSRKGIRGKMALFEHSANEPAPGFPARLMGNGHLSTIPSSEDVSAAGNQYNAAPSGMGGIISPGHDRPYRFSFYSNALSATIHARSLCELPAEGESFEALFSKLPSPGARHEETTGGPPPFGAPLPMPRSQSGSSMPNGQRTPGSSEFAPGSQTNGHFGRSGEKACFDPGRPDGPEASDSAANTWWLDILSPTDEEMKVLSKVNAPLSRKIVALKLNS